jgi:hypothetical protein
MKKALNRILLPKSSPCSDIVVMLLSNIITPLSRRLQQYPHRPHYTMENPQATAPPFSHQHLRPSTASTPLRLWAAADGLRAPPDRLRAPPDRLRAATDGLRAPPDGLRASTYGLRAAAPRASVAAASVAAPARVAPVVAVAPGHAADDDWPADERAEVADRGRWRPGGDDDLDLRIGASVGVVRR